MFKNRVSPLRVHQKLQHPTPLSPNVSICYLRVLQISISYPVCHLQRIFALLQHSHCIKYARTWVFIDRIVQYKNRIYDSVLIRRIRINEKPYPRIFYTRNLLNYVKPSPFFEAIHHSIVLNKLGNSIWCK